MLRSKVIISVAAVSATLIAQSAIANCKEDVAVELPKIGLLVTVDQEHNGKFEDIEAIADSVKSQGFDVDRVLPTGRFRAYGTSGDIETILSMEGVLDVKEEGGVQLAPVGPNIPQ